MLARTLPRVLGAAAFAVLLGLVPAVPSAAESAAGRSSPGAPTVTDQVGSAQLQTLVRQAGLSVAQAEQRLTVEDTAGDVVSTLQAALGSSFAGAWFEPGGTELVVATTDPAGLDRVRAAGAVPRLVSRDLPTLNRIRAVLDARAGSVADSVTGWYVDPRSNSVVVSATDPAAAERFVAGQPGVRIERVALTPRLLADLRGGDGIEASDGGRCSIGFNATAGQRRYIVTAGHCTQLGGTWSAENGGSIGPVDRSSFPGDDFGTIEVTAPSWQQTSTVNTSNGNITLTGTRVTPVGASVCRSGATTGYECGTVEATNETVNYGSGTVVYGLTRTTACAEPGDSGGPFISGSQAQGTLSGGTGSCFLSLFDPTTYFQPISEALSSYGLTLVTGSDQAAAD